MADVEAEKHTGPLGRRGALIGMAALVVVAIVAFFVWHYSGRQSTDDAQIDGHITQVSARVGGTVTAVHIKENQQVDAGYVLAELDPRDYQVAVDRAKAELADAQANATAASTGVPISEVTTQSGVTNATASVEEAQAGIGMAEQQVATARAQLAAAQARLREREATALKTSRDVERLKGLAAKEEIAQQQYDAAVAAADSARAAADAARSDVTAAESAIVTAEQRARQTRGSATQAQAALNQARTAPQQLEVIKARAAVALAQVQRAQSALDQAQLNLERTRIVAPAAGTVSRKSIEIGQVLQPGQPILALVTLGEVWVTANFKETQLKSMRVGQRATVDVDALGGRKFQGHVESIAAATGAKFSLLPPENATGNYVKVVQRIPVKIALEQGQDPNHQLRPGMSVAPTVFTK